MAVMLASTDLTKEIMTKKQIAKQKMILEALAKQQKSFYPDNRTVVFKKAMITTTREAF